MADQPTPPVPPYGTGATQSTGLAIGAMVCGLVGLFMCPLSGIVGLIMGIIALVQANREPSQYGGKGMAITGIVTGAISLLVVPALLISIMLPSLARARELGKRVKCKTNFAQLENALDLYTANNDGAFPPNLDVLIETAGITPSSLECPSARTANYIYIPGLPTNAPPDAPIFYEPIKNHGGEGGHIAFVDGSVRFVEKNAYEKVLAPYLGSSP